VCKNLLVFLVIGLLMILGIFFTSAVGYHNFTTGEAPFKGGFFAILWLGYKFIKKTKVVPLEECDFSRDDL
jgi:amino acid permease